MGESLQPEPLLSVKSKFDAEFRRFSISTTKLNYEEFEKKVRPFSFQDALKIRLLADSIRFRSSMDFDFLYGTNWLWLKYSTTSL